MSIETPLILQAFMIARTLGVSRAWLFPRSLCWREVDRLFN